MAFSESAVTGTPSRPLHSMIACPDCATIQIMPRITRGSLSCRTCQATLERSTGRSLDAALACSIATLALLLPANFCLLMRVSKAGIVAQSYLYSGVGVLWHHGWVFTAMVVALQAVILPLVRFGLLASVLGAIKLGRVGHWTGPAFRWCCHLDFWAMPDVFLLGFIIGYSRLAPFVPVQIGIGGWCLVVAALMTMLTRATHDRRQTWRRIAPPRSAASPPAGKAGLIGCPTCDLVLPASAAGSRCPRCGLRVWGRRPDSLGTALALVIAGFVLYPIANAYPLSVITLAGAQTGHTLFSSVGRLIDAHLWPLACVIFITSIGIPLGKLIGMAWLFLSIHRSSRQHLVAKTRVFRLIDVVGRWSNADIFTLAVYMPLVQFGQLATVNLGQGLPALQALVVVTMLASVLFDQRLVWDPARRQG